MSQPTTTDSQRTASATSCVSSPTLTSGTEAHDACRSPFLRLPQSRQMHMQPDFDRSTDADEPAGGWRAHMHFNAEAKRAKASKIVELLRKQRSLAGARVLDIGTGIGVIAAVLAESVGPDGRVISIDTMDTRIETTNYEF